MERSGKKKSNCSFFVDGGEQLLFFLPNMKDDSSIALKRAVKYLLDKQYPDGYWNAHLETNCCMEAQWILASVFCGIEYDKNPEIVSYIRSRQRGDGSWEVYHGAENGDVNTTLECYFALRLAGHAPDLPHMSAARKWLLDNHWHRHIRVFTKYWLALFGEWPWEDTPALPPEIIYFPKWFPFNIYRFAAWARATIVPLCIVTSQKPVKCMTKDLRMDELFPEGRKKAFGEAKNICRENRFSVKAIFNAVDKALHFYNGKSGNYKIHKLARKKAMMWMLEHQDDDGFWGGIQPPWIYGIIAMKLEGFDFDQENMAKAINALNLHWTETTPSGRRIKASESPVWDTILALNALMDAGMDSKTPGVLKAVDYLLSKENKYYGDWAQTVGYNIEPSGWAFQRENKFYPDIDDTAVAITALKKFRDTLPAKDSTAARIDASIRRAAKWLLAMQSKNGGWGAFDKDNTSSFVTKIPFCDFGEVLDPPSVDVTAHVIEALLAAGMSKNDEPVRRALAFVFSEQENDGSWFGRWGINYIYGTWSALTALAACGFGLEDSRIKKAADFLVSRQNSDGGWGENAATYMQPKTKCASTASQTAWAIIALSPFEDAHIREVVDRGLSFLKRTQTPEGTWEEEEFTGTGFPGYGFGAKADLRDGAPLPQGKELSRGFMLKYGLYCHYFPIAALAREKR